MSKGSYNRRKWLFHAEDNYGNWAQFEVEFGAQMAIGMHG